MDSAKIQIVFSTAERKLRFNEKIQKPTNRENVRIIGQKEKPTNDERK